MRVDELGLIYDDQDELIGYYDPDLKQCFDLDDRSITCLEQDKIPKEIIPTPKVEAKRTYWGLLVIVLVLALIAFFIYRMGKKKG